ncbi:MAG: Ribonuclease G, partial [uncultured Gemmatimonadetes bacterium]
EARDPDQRHGPRNASRHPRGRRPGGADGGPSGRDAHGGRRIQGAGRGRASGHPGRVRRHRHREGGVPSRVRRGARGRRRGRGRRGGGRRGRGRRRAGGQRRGRQALAQVPAHPGHPEEGPGPGGAGEQGAHQHQGPARHRPHLASRPLPGVHARLVARGRVAQDRGPRGARPAARAGQGDPSRKVGRDHRAHRGRGADARNLPARPADPDGHLGADQEEGEQVARAHRHPPRGQAHRGDHPRPVLAEGRLADGGHEDRLRRDPRLPGAGGPVARGARAPVRRRQAPVRRVRPGARDPRRLPAPGEPALRRLHHRRAHRGTGQHRRQHGAVHGKEGPRKDHPEDQRRCRARDRAAAAAARRGRHHRLRLHRHGVQGQPRQGAAGAAAVPFARPGAHQGLPGERAGADRDDAAAGAPLAVPHANGGLPHLRRNGADLYARNGGAPDRAGHPPRRRRRPGAPADGAGSPRGRALRAGAGAPLPAHARRLAQDDAGHARRPPAAPRRDPADGHGHPAGRVAALQPGL